MLPNSNNPVIAISIRWGYERTAHMAKNTKLVMLSCLLVDLLVLLYPLSTDKNISLFDFKTLFIVSQTTP